MSQDVDRIALHAFCPRCGAPGLLRQPPHLTVCSSCGLHLYHNAATAAAAIVADAAGNVLLIRRAEEPARGALAFPGGFIDDGESLEAGVRREVREETGLVVTELRYLTSHANRYAFRGVVYATIDVFFLASVADLSAARPLDAVAEIVVLPVAQVVPATLAFPSLRHAWSVYAALATGRTAPPA